MSSELKDIILTIDTREQNIKRIKAVEDWVQGHGAIVEHNALKLCDYALLGEFRGVPVNIGIEAKSLSQFCSDSYEENKTKLFDSFELYDNVALFIETGNYTYKFIEGVAVIDNPMVRDGSANVCPLAVLEGCCSTLPAYGIHVRQLRSESQFPDSIWNLLTYITGEHHIVKRTAKDNIRTYKQTLLNFMTGLQVKKAMTSYPNIHWLASASEDSLKTVFGAKTGIQINEILHFHDLETDEWRNNYCRDGTEKDNICGQPCYNSQHCDANCIKHPDFDKPKMLKENEGAQAFDARPKTPKKCAYADPKKREECKTKDNFKHSSHPGSFLKSVTPTLTPDDPQRPPKVKNSEVKQEVVTPPAETDLSYLDEKTEYREIKPNVIDPKAHKMTLEPTIKEFMSDYKPHTMQEIVDYCEGWGAPHIFDRVMANVKSGNIKKVTVNDKVTYQRIT